MGKLITTTLSVISALMIIAPLIIGFFGGSHGLDTGISLMLTFFAGLALFLVTGVIGSIAFAAEQATSHKSFSRKEVIVGIIAVGVIACSIVYVLECGHDGFPRCDLVEHIYDPAR